MNHSVILIETPETEPYNCNSMIIITQLMYALKAFIESGDLGINQPEAEQKYGENCLHATVQKLIKYNFSFECKTEKVRNDSNNIKRHIRYILINTDRAIRLLRLLELDRNSSPLDKRFPTNER